MAKEKGRIKDIRLIKFARREYREYGNATIEERAIIGKLDGLKPVVRFGLLAAYEMGLRHTAPVEKSAKVVGKTIGDFHPHGGEAAYEGLVTAANSPMKMIDGEGNWGTMTDNAAAMRYTNLRLSKYSDLVFFDPFYYPTITKVSNYDGSRTDIPLILPALLPNAVLNDNFGIATGVNTRAPAFTLKSVIKLIVKLLEKDRPCTWKDCMKLVFTTKYGGTAASTKSELRTFFKTGRGPIVFQSNLVVRNNNSLRVDRFAPFDIEKVLAKVESIKGVSGTRDDGGQDDPYQQAYVINFVRTLKGKALDHVMDKVREAFKSKLHFDVKVTNRYRNSLGQGKAKLQSTNTADILNSWIKYRLKLETKACKHWIKIRGARIEYLQLMMLATKHVDWIIKTVRQKNPKLTYDQIKAKVMTKLKITDEQAVIILDVPLKRLSALENETMAKEIKERQAEIAGYEKRIKDPRPYVIEHVKELGAKLKKEARV